MTRTITIIYAAYKSGLGDVGKFACILAHEQKKNGEDINIRAVALWDCHRDLEAAGKAGLVDVDVGSAEERSAARTALENIEVEQVVVTDREQASKVLHDAIKGSDAVVACVGNRQPGMKRVCALSTQLVADAMAANNVSRLVLMSSFGIGKDMQPFSFIKVLWGTMLATWIRSAAKDLRKMESIVTGSSLDYLIVRPVGVTPEVSPQGQWTLRTKPTDPHIPQLSVSKSDAALCMLNEALKPTHHRLCGTLGPKTKAPMNKRDSGKGYM